MHETHTFTSILTKLQSWRIAPLPKSFVIEAVQPFGRTPLLLLLMVKSGQPHSGQKRVVIP